MVLEFNSRRSNVRAANGMVASSQPLASQAGLRILQAGGHAVDAAVAAAAVLNVVEPQSTGVGGDLFALVWDNGAKKVYALNSSGRAGSGADRQFLLNLGHKAIENTSIFAVTVPGAPRGWETLNETFGRLSFGETLNPAINYAQEGFPVSEIISRQWGNGVARLDPTGADQLLIDGRAPAPGQLFSNPNLAGVLTRIGEFGADDFYKGDTADLIARYIQDKGGWVTKADLESHESNWVEPASTTYRNATAWECPPNSQGLHVLMALNIAETFNIRSMGSQSVDTYHHLIESIRLAFSDGLAHIADPNSMIVTIDDLLSKDYAATRASLIEKGAKSTAFRTGHPIPNSDTVYVSAVDSDGNACSLINSLYVSFGSGHVVPNTGIALQSRGSAFSLDPNHPNHLAPGKRPFHTLIPGMATKDGELWLCYGVMGTVQQAQGHFQMLVNMVDFDLTPQEALNQPRFSVRTGEGVGIESIADPHIAIALEQKGHNVIRRSPDNGFFGGGQIIERDHSTGVLTGGSEPRQDGAIAAW